MEPKYEYLVTYSRNSGISLWHSPRGRLIKQTLQGAKSAKQWALNKGYQVKVQRRLIGEWEEVDLYGT